MDFDRFREIIQRNQRNEEDVRISLHQFSKRVSWDGEVPKLMKRIGEDLDVFILELPMRDSDFGACFLKTPDSQYLLLNSNQPRCNMNFAFCHDIYHVLHGSPEHINELRQVHFNQDYLQHVNESKANLFAANLLMPEIEFRKMNKDFSSKYADFDKQVVLLMDYFEAPFVAVLLRLYELKIWNDVIRAKELLNYKLEDIKALFEELWITQEILNPTLQDDFGRLMNLLEKQGDELIQNELMSEFNQKHIIKTVKELYHSIRILSE